jgi:hypothetical protein
VALLASFASLSGCSSDEKGDPSHPHTANPIGDGSRVRDVVDPSKKLAGTQVNVSGAIVIAVDAFDETKNGKSRGTIYVQDMGDKLPYSGTSLFAPSFVPANLRVAAGDVLDLRGQYVEVTSVGTANFAGKVLPQIAQPAAAFRYEFAVPEPLEIDVNDLNDYDTGRKWLNMLVTIKNPKLYKGLADCSNSGRVVAPITDVVTSTVDCPKSVDLTDAERNGATVTNELFDLKPGAIPAKTELKSITGIVTWFFNFHIAPRSMADIKQ